MQTLEQLYDHGEKTQLMSQEVDPLARQGAEMSDTIALCTRILLTIQDPHSKELDHGGSSRAKGTRGGKQKRNITELWVDLARLGQTFIVDLKE